MAEILSLKNGAKECIVHFSRSRRERSNEYLLDEIGVDTAENEPLGVWGKIQFITYSPPCTSMVPVDRASAWDQLGLGGQNEFFQLLDRWNRC